MFIDMAHVKLGLCNYLNTSKEMITEYAIHSRFNKFQNVFFKMEICLTGRISLSGLYHSWEERKSEATVTYFEKVS